MVLIREAVSTDNAGLLHLTSLTPMKGRISLRIDRYPDFFSLLDKRGRSQIFVAERNGALIGCLSVSSIETLVNGNKEIVFYLADLKIHPSAGGKILVRLLNKMADHITQNHADLLFCTAAFGNNKVMPLFEGRVGFPKFHYAGTFRVFQIIPLVRKISPGKYIIQEIEMSEDVIDLYNKYYLRYQVAPLFSGTNLRGTRTIAAIDKNSIKASVTLSDISLSKQNVLIDLPIVLKLSVLLLRLLNGIVPFINLPEIGKPVKILYIKAFAFANGCEDALGLIIQSARNLAFTESYCYLTIGIHERDPIFKLFNKYLHFTFQSMGYVMSMNGNKEKVNKILKGVLFEDYSLV